MLIYDKKKCTGCSLCKEICPKKCIEMYEDDEGFLFPKVERKEDCINCNVCNIFCPYRKKICENKQKVFALQLKNQDLLKKCASGGAFAAIALSVMNLNGNVCGVSQINGKLSFIIINREEDIGLIAGSKYYQCVLTSEIYDKIEKLNSNNYFLFSGTPCQVAAIEIKFRKKFKNKLVTVEIICQGAPNERVVKRSYIELEKKYNSKIIEHKFRSKDQYVGRNYLNKYVFENGNIEYLKGSRDILTKSFQNQIFLRESCYKCNFTQKNRIADFTIGDLWKYDMNKKIFDYEKGVSVVVLNSKLSNDFFKNIDKYAVVEEIDDNCLKTNIPFNRSVKRPYSRNYSYKLLSTNLSFKTIVNICCLKYNIKQQIKKIIKKGD
ncbi:hypothetical protein DWV15_09945 [Coprobacillus sp. AF02-13]|nr:hypothetical protein DWV15_09945 [Coprobacillus sp. AF02-13]